MTEWIQQILDSTEFGALMIPAAFLLGLVSVFGSACNYGLLAAIAGFAGSRETESKRELWLAALSLVLGTIVMLAILGLLAAKLGSLAGTQIGKYGNIAAGLIIIIFGLAALKLLPFRLPSLSLTKGYRSSGASGAIAFGAAIGAGSVGCTLLCCGPLLPTLISLAVLTGEGYWGALLLGSFALGYSLPLAAALFGLSVGVGWLKSGRTATAIRLIAGIVMLAAGFWIIITA